LADSGHALFDTAIGRCALAWGPLGLTAVQLPEDSVQALLSGERRDLQGLPLDMSRLTGFQCAVYAIARAIPPGQTRSYGEIASELGDVKLARAVGQALGRNPFAPVVPCHRVLAAGNQPGGFSANGGAVTKMRMLAIEGVVPGATLPMFGEV
jgi:methylated-DNA-[protein]-cysteine S-methyltransferase